MPQVSELYAGSDKSAAKAAIDAAPDGLNLLVIDGSAALGKYFNAIQGLSQLQGQKIGFNLQTVMALYAIEQALFAKP